MKKVWTMVFVGVVSFGLLMAVPVVFAHDESKMMSGESMEKMMDVMDTPEGKKMIKACSNFMERLNQ